MRYCLVLILSLLTACAPDPGPLHQLGKGPVPRDALSGKWLVINYWAEWCKPCLEEIPELNRLHQRFQRQVLVAAVNFDGPQAPDLARAAADFDIRYMVLDRDPHTALGYERPQQLPTTILFDPAGELRFVRMGPQTAAELATLMGLEPDPHLPR